MRHVLLGTVVALAVALSGCGTVSRVVHASSVDTTPIIGASTPDTMAEPAAASGPDDPADPVQERATVVATGSEPTRDAVPVVTVETATGADSDRVPAATADTESGDDGDSAPAVLARAPATPPDDEYDIEEYDPWERFNETMFEFNRKLDRYVLKPVATVYDKVVPDELQRMIANAFDNVQSAKRFANSVLQGKWDGAVRELSRFLLNSTLGIGGLFDMGRAAEIQKSQEDFGQTLGFYGVGPGPYLILPFLEPLTVRDGIGKAVDGFMNPLTYIIPTFWVGAVLRIEEVVNDRSLNLELFQGFEETVIDMYSAVRHAYLERRRNLIRE